MPSVAESCRTSCFGNYFTGTAARQKDIKDPSCWRNFFTFNSAANLDKIMKFCVGAFELAAYSAKQNNVAPDIQKGLHEAHDGAKTVRLWTGMFAAWGNSLPAASKHAQKVVTLAGKLFGHASSPEVSELDAAPSESISRILLDMVIEFGDMVSNLTFAAAFGFCRPFVWATKYFAKRVSDSARSIGEAFVKVMYVNHITGFVISILKIVRSSIQYSNGEMVDGKIYDLKKHAHAVTANLFKFFEKASEVGSNSIKLFAASKVHPIATIILNVAAGTFGLTGTIYSVWKDTAAAATLA